MEKKGKYFLHSKGICFLCLKYKNVGDKLDSSDKQFSLREISRYINLNVCKLYRELNPNADCESNDSVEGEVDGEVFVSLCEKCSSIVESCSKLHKILEKTKLLLDKCVQKILGVMEGGRSNPSRVEEMRRILQGKGSFDFREFETLREEIMLKCDNKLKVQVPVAVEKRLSNNHLKRKRCPEAPTPPPKIANISEAEESIEDAEMSLTSPAPANLFANKDKVCTFPTSEIIVKCEAEDDEDVEILMESPSLAPADPLADEDEASNLEATTSINSASATPSPSGPSTCKYCNKIFPFSSQRVDSLRHHLSLHHPEHYLPNLRKLSNLTPEEFKEVAHHFLQKYIIQDNCSLCTKQYVTQVPEKRRNYLRTHLLQSHGKAIEKELIASKDISEFLKESDTCFTSKEGTFVRNNDDDLGEVGIKGDPFKQESPEDPIVCKYCKKQFDALERSAALHKHLRMYHPEHYFPKLWKISNLTLGDFKKVVLDSLERFIEDRNCSLCTTKYSIRNSTEQRQTVRTHLLQIHHEAIEENLMRQENIHEFMNETSKSKYLTPRKEASAGSPSQVNASNPIPVKGKVPSLARETPNILKAVPAQPLPPSCENHDLSNTHIIYSAFLQDSPSSPLECRYCEKLYANGTRKDVLHNHARTHHPEHYLPKLRKISNLSSGEFKQWVNHFVDSFTKDDNCSLCTKKYDMRIQKEQRAIVRMHLFQAHHQQMEEEMMTPQYLPQFMKETNEGLTSDCEKEATCDKDDSGQSGDNRAIGSSICQYCNKKITSTSHTVMLRHHMRACHPEHYLPEVRKLSDLQPMAFSRVLYFMLDKFIENNNCALCTKRYNMKSSMTRLQYVRTHLLQDHQQFLEEEFIKPRNISEFMKDTNTCLIVRSQELMRSSQPPVISRSSQLEDATSSSTFGLGTDVIPEECVEVEQVQETNLQVDRVMCAMCEEMLELHMLPTHKDSCIGLRSEQVMVKLEVQSDD